MMPTHPDLLAGEQLVARVQGDALQLAALARDHGPETLHRILDVWGPDHTRRVTIALAAAIDPAATLTGLWGWLGDPINRATVSYPESELFRQPDPYANQDPRPSRPRRITPETRARMADRARALAEKRRSA